MPSESPLGGENGPNLLFSFAKHPSSEVTVQLALRVVVNPAAAANGPSHCATIEHATIVPHLPVKDRRQKVTDKTLPSGLYVLPSGSKQDRSSDFNSKWRCRDHLRTPCNTSALPPSLLSPCQISSLSPLPYRNRHQESQLAFERGARLFHNKIRDPSSVNSKDAVVCPAPELLCL